MLFSPSLNILFSLCAVFSDRIESIKQPLSHIINKELKKFSLLFWRHLRACLHSKV